MFRPCTTSTPTVKRLFVRSLFMSTDYFILCTHNRHILKCHTTPARHFLKHATPGHGACCFLLRPAAGVIRTAALQPEFPPARQARNPSPRQQEQIPKFRQPLLQKKGRTPAAPNDPQKIRIMPCSLSSQRPSHQARFPGNHPAVPENVACPAAKAMPEAPPLRMTAEAPTG